MLVGIPAPLAKYSTAGLESKIMANFVIMTQYHESENRVITREEVIRWCHLNQHAPSDYQWADVHNASGDHKVVVWAQGGIGAEKKLLRTEVFSMSYSARENILFYELATKCRHCPWDPIGATQKLIVLGNITTARAPKYCYEQSLREDYLAAQSFFWKTPIEGISLGPCSIDELETVDDDKPEYSAQELRIQSTGCFDQDTSWSTHGVTQEYAIAKAIKQAQADSDFWGREADIKTFHDLADYLVSEEKTVRFFYEGKEITP